MSAAVAERPPTYEEERGKPIPGKNHSAIQANLTLEFGRDRTFRVHGELTLELAAPPNITPDLCVFSREPLVLSREESRVAEPPLLAVEILSPTQLLDDLIDKAERLLDHGVKSVWIVLPRFFQVTVLTAEGRKVFTEGIVTDPATGLRTDLASVFS